MLLSSFKESSQLWLGPSWSFQNTISSFNYCTSLITSWELRALNSLLLITCPQLAEGWPLRDGHSPGQYWFPMSPVMDKAFDDGLRPGLLYREGPQTSNCCHLCSPFFSRITQESHGWQGEKCWLQEEKDGQLYKSVEALSPCDPSLSVCLPACLIYTCTLTRTMLASTHIHTLTHTLHN